MLQCVTVRCSVLQSVSVVLIDGHVKQVREPISDMTMLQRVAACCSVLQCVAVFCSVVQCFAVR